MSFPQDAITPRSGRKGMVSANGERRYSTRENHRRAQRSGGGAGERAETPREHGKSPLDPVECSGRAVPGGRTGPRRMLMPPPARPLARRRMLPAPPGRKAPWGMMQVPVQVG